MVEGIHTNQVDPRFNDDGAQFASAPYPLLPDPRYTGVNQAYVERSGAWDVRVRAGRQIVRMDNQRWVGDNDFRQIPQLFDGVGAWYDGLPGAQLYGGYFERVRETSGTTESLRLMLLHAAWNPAHGHALAVYGYSHDQAQNGAFTGSPTAPIA